MTGEQLEAILKLGAAKGDKDGWLVFPDGTTVTLHIAHDGASMSVPRIEALRVDGDLVIARSPKKELFVFSRTDVFGVALEADAGAGRVARRAGFA